MRRGFSASDEGSGFQSFALCGAEMDRKHSEVDGGQGSERMSG